MNLNNKLSREETQNNLVIKLIKIKLIGNRIKL